MARKVRVDRTHEILFGPYLILDKIGEGGMGKVYRAVEIPAGRTVAIKIVRQHLMTNKTVKRRYKKEAEAAASLDHPNVVKLYDADEVHGRYYLSMEYIDGIDLSRMVKEFGDPPAAGLLHFQEACEYMRQAALGLQHAHDKNLVHRDIKPSNLLVHGERALPGTSGKAELKILDMGLVRMTVEDEDASRAELTRDGTVVGTPDYMSPEQAKNSSTVDARADLYSLGCTLYYLLRGRPPYPDGSPIDKLLRHQLDAPPDIRADRPDVPQGVSDVIRKLMAKRPADRYQTAREAAAALARFSGVSLGAAVPIVHEPFSFTDDPDAVVQETTPSPTMAGETPPTAAPAGGPPRPRVRLRVATPKAPRPPSAPARTVVAVVAPTAIPRPENPPSSDSLPGTGKTPLRTATTKSESGDVTIQTPRRIRRALPPTPIQKAPSKFPSKLLIVGVAVLAVLILVVAGVLLTRGLKLATPTTSALTVPPTTTDGQGTSTTTKPPGVVGPAKLPPLSERLPDGTTGLLVTHPQAYWKRVAYEKPAENRIGANVDRLTERVRLDLRQCELATVVWVGKDGAATFIAEGPFLTPTWAEWLETQLPVPAATPASPDNTYEFRAPVNGLKYATLLGADAYALAATPDALNQLQLRGREKKPPKATARALLRAVELPPGEEPPLLVFAAAEGYRLPEGDILSDHGVKSVTLTVRLVGDEFTFRIVVVGNRKSLMQDFLSIYLATRMVEHYPGIKPLTSALAESETAETTAGGQTVLTITGKLPWVTAHETLNQLLPNVAAE